MRATNRSGMTLVELMIAMALSLILVGTAAFVFITSQQIMSRVDTRLKAAQSFRVTSTVLDSDGARCEPATSFTTGASPAPQLRILSTGGPWFSLKRVDGAAPELRQDVVKFVTHASVAVAAAGVVQPPSDQTVLVTYQLKPGRGLVRTVDILTVSGNAGTGVITGTIDDSTLPNNQPPSTTTGGLEMDLAPGATGFAVRYLFDGAWLVPDPATGPTDGGTAFLGRMPTALEFTVFIPESTRPDSPRLSIVRTVEILPPPP